MDASRRATSILRYALAVVALWFGINEIIFPVTWEAFIPGFLGNGAHIATLVVIHGVTLSACGLAFVFNHYRRTAAYLFALLLFLIIADLVIQSGFSDIAIRDVGLFGATLALAVIKNQD